MARNSNPYLNDTGFITFRDNPLTGGHCILYDSRAAGHEQQHRWMLICSQHDTRHWMRIKRDSIKLLRQPADWCRRCRYVAEIEHAEYLLNLRSPRSDREQWRRLANLAVGDPEKSRLFETITGETPDHFLVDSTKLSSAVSS